MTLLVLYRACRPACRAAAAAPAAAAAGRCARTARACASAVMSRPRWAGGSPAPALQQRHCALTAQRAAAGEQRVELGVQGAGASSNEQPAAAAAGSAAAGSAAGATATRAVWLRRFGTIAGLQAAAVAAAAAAAHATAAAEAAAAADRATDAAAVVAIYALPVHLPARRRGASVRAPGRHNGRLLGPGRLRRAGAHLTPNATAAGNASASRLAGAACLLAAGPHSCARITGGRPSAIGRRCPGGRARPQPRRTGPRERRVCQRRDGRMRILRTHAVMASLCSNMVLVGALGLLLSSK